MKAVKQEAWCLSDDAGWSKVRTSAKLKKQRERMAAKLREADESDDLSETESWMEVGRLVSAKFARR